MQLTIIDNILYATKQHRVIYTEERNYMRIIIALTTGGYRLSTAQAIAYGILSDREKTIALGKRVKLLQ